MATENVNVLPSAVADENTFIAKKRSNRGFGGHPRRRVTAAARNRERQVPIDECHLKSQCGLQLPLSDGASQVTFQYYLGEHQSQIFYGGLTIAHPGADNIHVELGRPVPIDLRENYLDEGSAPSPCLAVPTHIFRRFRVYRITSSVSCDLKKLAAASLPTDGASPDESDASCPSTGEKATLLFPSTTPKSGLSLISLRVYYPIQHMQTANALHPTIPGSRKRAHLAPQHDEVVAYQNLLTMPVGDFASRVLRGVAGSASLLDCSSELPKAFHLGSVDLNESESEIDPSLHQENSTNQLLSFLILPVSVYNRFSSMKRILLEGYKSPIRPSMGCCVATLQSGAEKRKGGLLVGTPAWDRWIGMENVSTTPSWIIGKLKHREANSNARMVFVRRQSDDCGSVICPSLRKSIFGPARIRRTRMKGTDQLVMKVKQLISTSNRNPLNGPEEGQNIVTSIGISHNTNSVSMDPMETLNFRYVWSRDYRSNPVRRGALGPLPSTDIECSHSALSPLLETAGDAGVAAAPLSSSVTNASTDEEETRSIGERWHENHQQQRHHRRPTRSCLPPQRLEAVDRDLEKALQRSLADGRNKHTNQAMLEPSTPQPPFNGKRRLRQKRGANSFSPSSEEQVTHKLHARTQNGMKRTKSEATLQEFSNLSASKPLESETTAGTVGTWTHRLRSNSPSATSDSAISNCQCKEAKDLFENKTSQNVNTIVGIERSHFLPRNDAERHAVAVPPKMVSDQEVKEDKIAMEMGTSIPKLTLAIGENGRVRVKPQCYQMHQTAVPPPATAVDPYALPSSPVNNAHNFSSTLKNKRRSPSPPVLLPEEEEEEEIDPVNSNEQNGNAMLQGEDWRGSKREMTADQQPTPTFIGSGSTCPHAESELSQSQLLSLPLSLSLPSTQRAMSQFGVHSQHSVFPPFPTSEAVCSAGTPVFAISLPSSLQQFTNTSNQPVLTSTLLPTPPNIVPSTSLQTPGGYSNNSLLKPNSSKHIASSQLNDSFWSGDRSTGRRPATMWTPRNEPLPPPDPPLLTHVPTMTSGDGLCFFHHSSTAAVPAAVVSPAPSFQSTFLPSVIPIQQHQISTSTSRLSATPTTETTSIHQQAFLSDTATGYSMLTSDAATALAMAAVAYFNPSMNSIYASTILQPPAPGQPPGTPISNQPPVTAVRGRFL